MRHYRLLYILLIILPVKSFTQALYERADTVKRVFAYVPYERSNNNRVLNQLALAHLKIPEKTSFQYTLRYKLTVNFSNNDSLNLMLDVNPIDIKGDIRIKDFNVSQLLVPSIFDVSYTIVNNLSGNLFERKELVTLDDGIAKIASFPDSIWNETCTIELRINKIMFSDKDYRRLEYELSLIRDYYASASLSDTLLNKIRASRKNVSSFEEAIGTYIIGLKGYHLLEYSFDNYEITLGFDPLRVKPKVGVLKYTLDEYYQHITTNFKIPLIGNSYLNFTEAYLKSLRTAEVMSRKVDYYSSPYFYRLYANSITTTQLLKIKKAISKEVHNRNVRNYNADQLFRYITRGYINESNRLISERKYVEAVDLLTGITRLMNASGMHNYSLEISNGLSEARKGLVYSYTDIIRKSLDKGLITLAEKYLAEIQSYTVKYEMTNREKGQFNEIYTQMADIHIKLGNNLLSKNEFNAAIIEFQKAQELLSDNEYLKSKAETGTLIAVRELYDNKISLVLELLKKNDLANASASLIAAEHFASAYTKFYPDKTLVDSIKYVIALNKRQSILDQLNKGNRLLVNQYDIDQLTEAVYLSEQFNFPYNSMQDTLIMQIGLPYVNKIFSAGRLKHWASQPDSALYYATTAYSIASRLNIQNTGDIKSQYDNLTSMAGETYCSEFKGEYQSMLNQAEEFFKQNKFKQAVKVTNSARELVYSKATCGLTTAELNKLLLKYQNNIKWDNLVTDAFALLDESKFQEAALKIRQAEDIYSYNRFDTLGISNVGYYDLAISSTDIGLLRHAISYQVIRNHADKAMNLLEKLRLTGYESNAASDLQETVARNLAIRDIAETPDLNVKIMLATYTGNNKWYSKFESVYRYYTKSNTNILDKTINRIDDLRKLF